MKSIVTAALVALACTPVPAAEPATTPPAIPVEASPVLTETPPAPSVITKAGATAELLPARPANQSPSFCGQDAVLRLFRNTEIGRQLQLRQQEALREAIAQAVAEGRIPAQQPGQPKAAIPRPTQPAPVIPSESTPPNTTSPQE